MTQLIWNSAKDFIWPPAFTASEDVSTPAARPAASKFTLTVQSEVTQAAHLDPHQLQALTSFLEIQGWGKTF